MSPQIPHRRKLIEYDAFQRRLWILGQRCHHGATGAVVAAGAFIGVLADRHVAPAALVLAATGGALMVHDWKDRAIWFEPGYGSQPAHKRLAASSYTTSSAVR